MDDLARFFDLERRLLERLSTRVEPFAHGVAFFDEGYRERYNSNFLLAEGPLESVSAGALAEEADRILGGAGYAHRELVVRDDRAGGRLGPALAEHGFRAEHNVVMAHRREPDREPDLPVEELPFAEVRPLIREIYRRDESRHPEEIVRLFTEQHGKNERVLGARFFVVRLDGALAGDCELYVDGQDAQVEFVDTLEEFRGRGVARAMVLRAIEAARSSGARRVFIVADDDDWPKDLYARLGFVPIGRIWTFIRPGDTSAGMASAGAGLAK
jgi:GNAT superfamily N-acetyltransferase